VQSNYCSNESNRPTANPTVHVTQVRVYLRRVESELTLLDCDLGKTILWTNARVRSLPQKRNSSADQMLTNYTIHDRLPAGQPARGATERHQELRLPLFDTVGVRGSRPLAPTIGNLDAADFRGFSSGVVLLPPSENADNC